MALGKRLLLALGSLVAALLLGEAVLRVVGLDATPEPAREGRLRRATGRAERPYEYVPGAERTHTFRRGDGSVTTSTSRINTLGFRGPERPAAKPEGVLRVACLGDSFTFGYGVDEHETWPAQLQRRLDGALGAGRVEVWNHALEGSDTREQVFLFEERVLDFKPDLVLLGFYLNDVGPPAGSDEEPTGLRGALRRLTARDRGGAVGWLRERSNLVDLLGERVHMKLSRKRYADLYTAEYTGHGEGWQACQTALLRLRDVCRARGIPLVVLTYPTLSTRGEHFASDAAYAVVRGFGAGNEIEVLDLTEALREERVQDLRVHPLDQHPNGRAHGLVAAWLAEQLLTRPPLAQP